MQTATGDVTDDSETVLVIDWRDVVSITADVDADHTGDGARLDLDVDKLGQLVRGRARWRTAEIPRWSR